LKAQREADAAAAKAAAAEADAAAAAERSVTNDFKNRMASNAAKEKAEENARLQRWAETDNETRSHFAATEASKQADAEFFRQQEWSRTRAAMASDKQASDSLLAAGAAKRQERD